MLMVVLYAVLMMKNSVRVGIDLSKVLREER